MFNESRSSRQARKMIAWEGLGWSLESRAAHLVLPRRTVLPRALLCQKKWCDGPQLTRSPLPSLQPFYQLFAPAAAHQEQ